MQVLLERVGYLSALSTYGGDAINEDVCLSERYELFLSSRNDCRLILVSVSKDYLSVRRLVLVDIDARPLIRRFGVWLVLYFDVYFRIRRIVSPNPGHVRSFCEPLPGKVDKRSYNRQWRIELNARELF